MYRPRGSCPPGGPGGVLLLSLTASSVGWAMRRGCTDPDRCLSLFGHLPVPEVRHAPPLPLPPACRLRRPPPPVRARPEPPADRRRPVRGRPRRARQVGAC